MIPAFLTQTTPTSSNEILAQFQSRFTNLLSSGDYTPFVWPHRAFGPYLLIFYLLLPPTNSKTIYYARYPLFGIIIYLSINSIRECRSATVTAGYGIGLLNAWAVLWSASLIIINDARADFRRIEEQKGDSKRLPADIVDGRSTGLDNSSSKHLLSRTLDGQIDRSEQDQSKNSDSPKQIRYRYQGLPTTFRHRLDWVLDLVSNFRGVRWTYQISGLATPPKHIQSSLDDSSLPKPNDHSHLCRTDLLRRDLPIFILNCVAVDILKTVTSQDPYFWGLPPSTPSPFPFPVVSRLILTLLFVYTSLLNIFLLAPLVFGVLLGPRYIGEHSWPWLYSPYFGPLEQVWKKGIAGFWGGWWHQLFRFAFEQAGEWVGRVVGWEKKSLRGMALRVLVAFGCSGILHACASYTSLGNTRPIGGSFMFFMIQPVGIFGQKAVTAWMRKVGLRERIPPWLREFGNVMVVMAWCYLVGPNIADEFAATGIWLYEPLPISCVRGLRGEGWWHWSGSWVRWHTGERWWQSGLAL